MERKEKGAILICLFLCIIVMFVVFTITIRHYQNEKQGRDDLQRKVDSLNIVLNIKSGELKTLNATYDSIKEVSKSQSGILDSLLLARKNKRNEKKIRSISDIPDDEINSILSDRLK